MSDNGLTFDGEASFEEAGAGQIVVTQRGPDGVSPNDARARVLGGAS